LKMVFPFGFSLGNCGAGFAKACVKPICGVPAPHGSDTIFK